VWTHLLRIDSFWKVNYVLLTADLKSHRNNRHVQYSNFLNGCYPNVGTFLHEAVRHEKRDVVRALLAEGSDPGALDEEQDTALDLAESSEMRQVFADALIQSAASGNLEQMTRLLRAGMDISVIDTPTTKKYCIALGSYFWQCCCCTTSFRAIWCRS